MRETGSQFSPGPLAPKRQWDAVLLLALCIVIASLGFIPLQRNDMLLARTLVIVVLALLAALTVTVVRLLRAEHRSSLAAMSLSQSEAIYRSMVVGLNDGVMILDATGRVLRSNPSAERILRRSFAEMSSQALDDWQAIDIDGRPVETADTPVSIALAQGIPQREVTLGDVDASGAVTWLSISVEPLRNGVNGSISGAVVSFTDITERRRVDGELIASEATNRALMNSLADGLLVVQDGRFVQANPAVREMLGYGKTELVGRSFDEVIAPGMLLHWTALVERKLRPGEHNARPHDMEFLTRDDRGSVQLELIASPSSYRGRPAVTALVRDINERRQAAAELELYRGHLEDLVNARTRELREALANHAEARTFAQIITDNQPTLLAYIGPGYRLEFANRAFLDWYGTTRESVIGKTIPDALGDGALLGREDMFERLARGEAVPVATELVDSHGSVGHFLIHRIADIRADICRGYYFIATNVTQLRQAEQRLQELNTALSEADEFARRVADNIPGRVSYWDAELRCRFANKGYCDELGWMHDRLIGASLLDVVGPERFESLRSHLLSVMRDEPQRFERSDLVDGGQHRITQVHYTPDMRDGAVRGFFVLGLDVTQSREDQCALQRLNDELVISRDKAQAAAVAKSAFLANMSHEIRTPMNAIIGLTHLMRRDKPIGLAAERLTHVSDAAQHLMGIINNVLDLSKIESGKVLLEETEFDPEALLARACSLVAGPARDKELALRIVADGLPPRLCGDAVRLSQALVNLLSNAVKFTERGSIAISASTTEISGDALMLRIEVQDTGIGLAPDVIDVVFNNFEQADSSTTRRFGGTGLGLGITRRLARLMGGDCGAHSTLGEGSMFWITARLRVPSAPPAARPAPEPSRGNEAIAARELRAEQALRAGHEGARILVVEDNPVNQEVALTLLLSAGLQVDIAQDGREAIEMANAGAYALILMDIQMPGIDGLEATRVLRQHAATSQVPIIAMTANVQPSDCASYLAAGVTDHLPKPVEPVVLYDMLLRWLGSASTGPAPLARTVAGAQPPPVSAGQLNTARGVAFFAGNQTVYATALGQFCTMYASGIDGLQACLDDRSEAHAKALRSELHSLRGASAALGAETFARQVHQLEDALRDGRDAAPIGPALNELRDELKALIDEMRETATTTAQAGSGAS